MSQKTLEFERDLPEVHVLHGECHGSWLGPYREIFLSCSRPAEDFEARLPGKAGQPAEILTRLRMYLGRGPYHASRLQSIDAYLKFRCGYLGVVRIRQYGRACMVILRWSAMSFRRHARSSP